MEAGSQGPVPGRGPAVEKHCSRPRSELKDVTSPSRSFAFTAVEEEIMGGWDKLFNEARYEVYYLPEKSKKSVMGGICSTYWEVRNVYLI